MTSDAEDTRQILEQLADAPAHLKKLTRGVPASRLDLRSEAEPWSISDILAHLRACADVWGASILAMITQDNPVQRYVSPRSRMKKPAYVNQAFSAALEAFAKERQTLAKALAALDAAGWARQGTFTGTSPGNQVQTVLSYAQRLANHEQAHLDQIETLLK